MPRKLRYALALDSASARLALPIRKKFYAIKLGGGTRLAYRRNAGTGTWTVLAQGWSKRFALADDHEASNHGSVLDFHAAVATARKLARNEDTGDVDGGRPALVREAVDAYERDLKARDGNPANAGWLRFHVPPATMAKPVALLTPREVRAIRDGLLDKGLTRATANRFMKAFAACLTLAANDDERIANRKAWKLPGLPDATKARNVILSDAKVRDAVTACYETGGARFGEYAEVLATTGVRPVQARRLVVADLEADHRNGPRVMMPSSKKGKGRKRIERTALPIPAGLAARLKIAAAGRADDAPLLRDDAGKAWTANSHTRPFAAAAAAAKLPRGATCYSLRHSSIVRALLKGIPTRLVAAAHDTSVAMIEKTYSKYIMHPGADLMRAALIDLDAPAPAATVVSIARTKPQAA